MYLEWRTYTLLIFSCCDTKVTILSIRMSAKECVSSCRLLTVDCVNRMVLCRDCRMIRQHKTSLGRTDVWYWSFSWKKSYTAKIYFFQNGQPITKKMKFVLNMNQTGAFHFIYNVLFMHYCKIQIFWDFNQISLLCI